MVIFGFEGAGRKFRTFECSARRGRNFRLHGENSALVPGSGWIASPSGQPGSGISYEGVMDAPGEVGHCQWSQCAVPFSLSVAIFPLGNGVQIDEESSRRIF